VQLHTGTTLAAIDSVDDAFTGVRLADGSTLTADLLLVGIGVQPDMRLAEAAGLACGNGILVGADMQTSHPGIYAIGDVALADETAPQINATPIRVESVHNAQDSAARAAAALTDTAPPARQAPWFWSEQFDARLQSAGIVPPAGNGVQQVTRPGKRDGGHSVWSYDAGRLCAVEAVRDTAGYMMGKRCLEAGLSPHPDDVANPDFDLKSYLARQ
jgi:NADPH-dependent 2,4-dienoyl-CoA reductase/sulfur reductase-like enzyme